MALTIRLARLEDAPRLAEILCRAWDAAYADILPAPFIAEKNAGRLEALTRNLSGENDRRYALLSGERVAGMMVAAPPDVPGPELSDGAPAGEGDFELHALYLHPETRGKGFGRAAMQFALDLGRKAGKNRMLLWVMEENAPAIGFYRACGFSFDGARTPYACGKKMDLLRMTRPL